MQDVQLVFVLLQVMHGDEQAEQLRLVVSAYVPFGHRVELTQVWL